MGDAFTLLLQQTLKDCFHFFVTVSNEEEVLLVRAAMGSPKGPWWVPRAVCYLPDAVGC